MLSIVLDTNVLVSALRSKNGASYALLERIDSGLFEIYLSVPLVFEYEDVLGRTEIGVSAEDAGVVIDYLCFICKRKQVHFLWRPTLKDAKDDMLLELAVAGQCQYIVTHNLRDFLGCEKFGVQAISPAKFLKILEN